MRFLLVIGNCLLTVLHFRDLFQRPEVSERSFVSTN